MVTKIRLELVLLFLCLPLLAGRELAAQTRHENRQNELSEKFGYILAPVMSKDGVWLTVYKRAHFAVWEACELGKDTVMIFNLSDIGKARTPIKRPNILNMSFLGNSHLLLSSSLQTELLNLGDQTSIYFKGVKQFKTLNAGRLFLLHYNEEGKNRLELRDYNGEIIKTVTGVTRFYTSKKGSIYVITVNGKKGHDIYSLKGEKPYSIYRSTNKIVSLEPDPDDRGVMIFEQTPKISTLEVRYLDLKTNQCFSLKDALPLPLENCFSDVIREGEIYFLSPWIKGEREDSSLVDIWYKNDNKLEEKFYTPTREVYYVWEPGKNRIQRIGNDTLINNVFTGNEH